MKKDIFNMLENAGDDDMRRLMDMTPGFDSDTSERLLKMSEKKYNIKKNNIAAKADTEYETEISGVDTYKRPVWTRLMPVAASLVLVAGALAVTGSLLKSHAPGGPDDPEPPVIAASTEDPSAPTDTTAKEQATTIVAASGTAETAAETAQAGTETSAVSAAIVPGAPASDASSVQAAGTAESTKPAAQAVTTAAAETDEELIDRLGREGYMEDPEYTAIAKEVLKRYENNYRVCCAPEYKYFDFSDSFEITYNEPGMFGPTERTVTYVRYNDPDFSSFEEMNDNLEKTVPNSLDVFQRWIGNSVTPGCYLDYYDAFPTTTEYNGKLYANPEKSPKSPDNPDIQAAGLRFCMDKPILIEYEGDDEFWAWTVHENWNYTENDPTEGKYYFAHPHFRKYNGVWAMYEFWNAEPDEYMQALREHTGIEE